MFLWYVDGMQRIKWMGPVANGRGGEEEKNLRAINMVHDIFNPFAKQPCYEREHQWGSAEGSLEVCT
jgi:hypothetical protein